jgi:hypothetical protein
MERRWSRKEILALFPGLSNRALNALMKDGKIPFEKINRKAIYFDPLAVVAALSNKELRHAVAPEQNWSAVEAIEAREKKANAIVAKFNAVKDQVDAAARDNSAAALGETDAA